MQVNRIKFCGTGSSLRKAGSQRRRHPFRSRGSQALSFFEIDSYGGVYHNPDDRDKIVEGLRQAGIK
jgi:hypothetical protein